MAPFANLAFGLVRTPPSPALSGTSLALETGHGLRFPPAPFDATLWPVTAMPDPTNAEIVRVTAVVGDTLTLLRAQQGSVARAILAGDQLANTLTKTYLDAVPLTSDPAVAFTGDVTAAAVTATTVTATDLHAATAAVSADLTVGGAASVAGNASIGGNVAIVGTLGVVGVIQGARLRGYREPWQTASIATGTLSLDYALGNHAFVTPLSDNVTGISITNLPPAGEVAAVMIYYTAASGGHTVAHIINFQTVRFAGAVLPVMSTVAGRIDRILYTTFDGGATWLGDIIGMNY